MATSTDGVNWTWVGTINQLVVSALANDTPASTGVPSGATPEIRFHAGAPSPNPAHGGSTPITFPFTLPAGGTVGLEVYDVRGRLVARRAPETFAAGEHALQLTPATLPSGIYFARLATDSGLAARTRWALVR